MEHRNAPLTRTGRLRLVRLVVEDGFTFAAAAAAANVAASTVHCWVARWRAASEAERSTLVCLEDRSSRPHTSPTMLSQADHDRVCEVRQRSGWGPRLIAPRCRSPHATVSRALARRGCSRRPRAPREAVLRYEWPCPGNLLHMDVKRHARFVVPGHAVTGDRTRNSAGAGWEYVHVLEDDCSRLAYAEVCDDRRRAPAHRQRLGLHQEQGPARPAGRPGDRAQAHPPLHAPHQRQSRAPAPDDGPRMGERTHLQLKRRPTRRPATLAHPLQQATPPLSHRQPTTHHPHSERPGARHLEGRTAAG